jgi:hypothetical protein
VFFKYPPTYTPNSSEKDLEKKGFGEKRFWRERLGKKDL